MTKEGNKMAHNHAEKELFYPDGTIMYQGGVKKMISATIFMMARAYYLTKMVNDYSRVNSSII